MSHHYLSGCLYCEEEKDQTTRDSQNQMLSIEILHPGQQIKDQSIGSGSWIIDMESNKEEQEEQKMKKPRGRPPNPRIAQSRNYPAAISLRLSKQLKKRQINTKYIINKTTIIELHTMYGKMVTNTLKELLTQREVEHNKKKKQAERHRIRGQINRTKQLLKCIDTKIK